MALPSAAWTQREERVGDRGQSTGHRNFLSLTWSWPPQPPAHSGAVWMGGWILTDLRLGRSLPQREKCAQGDQAGAGTGPGKRRGLQEWEHRQQGGAAGDLEGWCPHSFVGDDASESGTHLGWKSTFPGPCSLLGAAPRGSASCGAGGAEEGEGTGAGTSPGPCQAPPLPALPFTDEEGLPAPPPHCAPRGI